MRPAAWRDERCREKERAALAARRAARSAAVPARRSAPRAAVAAPGALGERGVAFC